MKRLYAWLAGVVGGAAVYRAWRRPKPAAPPAAEPDPAEALKAKLAETRSVQEPPQSAEPESDVDARRRSVHERARMAIDDMHKSDPS